MWQVKILAKNFQKQPKARHAITSIKEHVCRASPMRQGGSYISTYVRSALPVVEKTFPHPEVECKNKVRNSKNEGKNSYKQAIPQCTRSN